MSDASPSVPRPTDAHPELAELYAADCQEHEDVPPLADQLERAEELTHRQPQPPMDGAPEWLRAAIKRWRSEGGY